MSQAISAAGDRRPLGLPLGIPVPLIAGFLVAGAAITATVIDVVSVGASVALANFLPALLLYYGPGVVSGGLLIVAAWHPGLLRSAAICLAAAQMVLPLWSWLQSLTFISAGLGSLWFPPLLGLVADLPLLVLALLRWGRVGEIVWKVVAAPLAVASIIITWPGMLLSLWAVAAMVTWAGVLVVVFALSANPTRRYYQRPIDAIVVWPDHSTTALPVVALAGEASRVDLAQPYAPGHPSDQSVPSDARLPVAVQTPDVNPALPLAGPSIPASPAGGRRQTPSIADVTRYGRPT